METLARVFFLSDLCFPEPRCPLTASAPPARCFPPLHSPSLACLKRYLLSPIILLNDDNHYQITSWWSASPPQLSSNNLCDPTDPRMNPLNPKGLKPYVTWFVADQILHWQPSSYCAVVVHALQRSLLGTTVSWNTTLRKRKENASKSWQNTLPACVV